MGLPGSPLTFSKKLNQNPQVGYSLREIPRQKTTNNQLQNKNDKKMGLPGFEPGSPVPKTGRLTKLSHNP